MILQDGYHYEREYDLRGFWRHYSGYSNPACNLEGAHIVIVSSPCGASFINY